MWIKSIHHRQKLIKSQSHGKFTRAPSLSYLSKNKSFISSLNALQNSAVIQSGLLCITSDDASVASSAAISAAEVGEIRPMAAVRRGVPTLMRHVHMRGITGLVSTNLS